jgi:hypothetical protein
MRKLLNLLYNFHWIVPGEAARSSQAHVGFLRPFLENRGLKGMVNLRGRHTDERWWRYETTTCAQDILHLDAMLDSRKLPTRKMLADLFDAFDAAPKPFVLKCSGGHDRTSFAAALYIVHRFGWETMDRAQSQFVWWPYWHIPGLHQRWLSRFLPYAREQAAGATLGDWVRRDYDPHAFAAWLNAHGLSDGYNGIWEPWKPPSR